MRYNGKRVIWESKRKLGQSIFFAAIFVVALLLMGKDKSPFLFWTGLIFFGGGGIVLLVMLFSPGNLFAGPGSPLVEKIGEEQFERMQVDTGFFEYTDTGFFFSYNKKRSYFDWHQIQAIFAWKEVSDPDDLTGLAIFAGAGKSLTVTEEMPGWFVFKEHLLKHFPAIPADWDRRLVTSHYEIEMTLLFDSHGRSQTEAAAYYYQ